MKRKEDFFPIRSKILEISKNLKSHYLRGEFIDTDKNFNELLEKIIV